MIVKDDPWETMKYPTLRLFVLRLFREHDFVAETKRKIDRINAIAKQDFLDRRPGPPGARPMPVLYPDVNSVVWPRPPRIHIVRE